MEWLIPFLLKISFAIAIAAHGADLATTEYCLGQGRCVEVNMVLAPVKDPFWYGTIKMGGASVGEILVYELSKENAPLAIKVNFSIGGVFTGIAYHNSQVGRGGQK